VGQDSDAKKNRQGHDAVSEVRATDALANERTFLAYVRTALGFIGLGFVIARFSLFLHEAAIVAHMSVPSSGLSSAFGAWMALTGVACGLFGGYRYVVSARALRAGCLRIGVTVGQGRWRARSGRHSAMHKNCALPQ